MFHVLAKWPTKVGFRRWKTGGISDSDFFGGWLFDWLEGVCFFRKNALDFPKCCSPDLWNDRGKSWWFLLQSLKKNPRCIGFDWRMSQHDCEDLKRNGMIPQFTKSCGYSNSGIWAAVENFSGCFGIEKKVCCVSAGFGQILVWKDGWLPVWYHSFASVISQIFWISFGYYFFYKFNGTVSFLLLCLFPPKTNPPGKHRNPYVPFSLRGATGTIWVLGVVQFFLG